MKAPGFWHRPPGLAARALSPLGAVYAHATARRLRKGSVCGADVPVICVGNINAGGTGKTPCVIALVELLGAMGRVPHILSRGYGGALAGPLRVDPGQHDADAVGDEPLLLSQFAPTWIGVDRCATAKQAQAAGADVLIMDDGHQNPALRRDLSLVTVDARVGFGNGYCIPAGPLREPVSSGLDRADFLLSIGPEAAQTRFARSRPPIAPTRHLTGQLEPLLTGMDWRGLNTLAFAGIGHPEKFFATLKSLGANLKRAEPLADHQPLTEALMARLEAEANLLGAQLVTTEKDAVRLPAGFRAKVLTLPVRLRIGNDAPLAEALSALF